MITATLFDWLYHAARWTWHHPDESPSAEQVLAAHAEHRRAVFEGARHRVAAVHDVRVAAHEVAADVRRVAEDVEAETAGNR